MSLGYVGKCIKLSEDEEQVLYSYSGENWNSETSREGDRDLQDGLFVIYKNIEADDKIIFGGKAKVLRECKNAVKVSDESVDRIACMLIWKVLDSYEKTGAFSEESRFIQ